MEAQTLKPIVMGQSVLGLVYKDGVMMAADTLLSYGSQRKFKNIQRIFAYSQAPMLVGFTGEYSDVQHIQKLIEAQGVDDFVKENLAVPKCAKEYHGYLTRVLYNRRNKFDPLWNHIIVGGFDVDRQTPFLGYVDYQGTHYTDSVIATGFGSYLAIPLLREKASVDMSEAAARDLLEQAMRVLYARDCHGYSQIQIGTVTQKETIVQDPFTVQPNWNLKAFFQESAATTSALW